ncbi:hypothetical protein BT96DRAFT_772830, partial [Gymnopus androsaceus JB14]
RSAVGEGTREVSWIWKEGGTGKGMDQEVLEEIIRVEWCKAYSRSRRWGEEVELLTEEMRRSLVTLEYNAKEWERRTDYRGALGADKDVPHAEGVRAFALSQTQLYRDIAMGFQMVW